MKLMDFNKISIPIGVKGLHKYRNKEGTIFKSYYLRTPVHVKSALHYNDFLKYKKISRQYSGIHNGEKIKWVYLKQNPLGIETIAYKGHEDPPEVLDFIREYIHPDKIYTKALYKKIMRLYRSMKWSEPTDPSKTIERFF